MIRPGLALFALASLAACLGPGGGVPQNAIFTDVAADGETITGRYDPTGFTSAEVQRIVANVCTRRRMTGYVETRTDAGLMFQFTCRSGNPYGANAGINFARTTTTTAAFSAVYSNAGGDLVSASGEVSF